MLQELRWELSAVTPLDLLDPLLERLRLHHPVDPDDVRRRAETILVLAATEYKFCYLSPSLMAAAALQAVVQGALRAILDNSHLLAPGSGPDRVRRDLRALLGNLQVLSHSPAVRN